MVFGGLLLLGLGAGGGYLSLKVAATDRAVELAVDWNPERSCSVTTYALAAPGETAFLDRLFRLVVSPTFFRVHARDGRLLKSSEWLFWQREAGDREAPRWANSSRVLYPTTEGYASWTIPECGTPSPPAAE